MPRTVARFAGGMRLSDHLGVSVIARVDPREAVRAALRSRGRDSRRRRDLPAEVMVCHVIAMALFRTVSAREVLRCLVDGLRWISPDLPVRVSGKSSISRARLGAPRQLRGAAGASRDARRVVPGAAPGGLRRLGAEPARRGAQPRGVRPSGIVARQLGVPAGAADRDGGGRHARGLRLGMLALADRCHCGFPLWSRAAATGADLLWRCKGNMKLPVVEALDDGSWRSVIRGSGRDRRRSRGELPVRILACRIEGGDETVTLAALYHERREIETACDEVRTRILGPGAALRSKTPDLVRQKIDGLMLAHHAARCLIHEAAGKAGEDPDRMSFVHAVHVMRRRIINPGDRV